MEQAKIKIQFKCRLSVLSKTAYVIRNEKLGVAEGSPCQWQMLKWSAVVLTKYSEKLWPTGFIPGHSVCNSKSRNGYCLIYVRIQEVKITSPWKWSYQLVIINEVCIVKRLPATSQSFGWENEGKLWEWRSAAHSAINQEKLWVKAKLEARKAAKSRPIAILSDKVNRAHVKAPQPMKVTGEGWEVRGERGETCSQPPRP